MDPGSSIKGGDLGWNAPSVYARAFASAVTATAPGSYAPAPVHTPYGWHIVKVDAVRAMKIPVRTGQGKAAHGARRETGAIGANMTGLRAIRG